MAELRSVYCRSSENQSQFLRPMKVAATVIEKEKQVFYERPRSKVKISTHLDSDAEEAPTDNDLEQIPTCELKASNEQLYVNTCFPREPLTLLCQWPAYA